MASFWLCFSPLLRCDIHDLQRHRNQFSMLTNSSLSMLSVNFYFSSPSCSTSSDCHCFPSDMLNTISIAWRRLVRFPFSYRGTYYYLCERYRQENGITCLERFRNSSENFWQQQSLSSLQINAAFRVTIPRAKYLPLTMANLSQPEHAAFSLVLLEFSFIYSH